MTSAWFTFREPLVTSKATALRRESREHENVCDQGNPAQTARRTASHPHHSSSPGAPAPLPATTDGAVRRAKSDRHDRPGQIPGGAVSANGQQPALRTL